MSNIIRHIFVYGSLRPDDNSNQTWTKDAVSGLTAQRAKLYNTKLYHDQYACAVFDENDNETEGPVWRFSTKSDVCALYWQVCDGDGLDAAAAYPPSSYTLRNVYNCWT